MDSFTLSWRDTVLNNLMEFLSKKLNWLLDSSLAWLRRLDGAMVYPVINSEMTFVKNVLLLLKSFTDEYLQDGAKLPKDVEDPISNACLFSVVWGLGGVIHESQRKPFNDLLQKMITAASDIPEIYKLQL